MFFASLRTRFMDRLFVRLSKRARTPNDYVTSPEPRSIGSIARGQQLLAGNYQFAGYHLHEPNEMIWDIPAPSYAFAQEIHGFGWLDDLAAVGDSAAIETAQAWLLLWIKRFGHRFGPGWQANITGRRLIRWINHAFFLLQTIGEENTNLYYRSLGRQIYFLSKRWKNAPRGLPRFEALCGLIYAGYSLKEMAHLAQASIKGLEQECTAFIDQEGGLPTRNPEELLVIFSLLTWVKHALLGAQEQIPQFLNDAIERIAPTLRTLRHLDGSLARFHGGGCGPEGWLDYALRNATIKTHKADGLAMGFARLSAGRSSVIIDAAAPPMGEGSQNAHASTLAFELTSSRHPLIVSIGSGTEFGPEWSRVGRATSAHSTLELHANASAQIKRSSYVDQPEPIEQGPLFVPVETSRNEIGLQFQGAHDGYQKEYGLIHARTLEIDFEGRQLFGEDMLLATSDETKNIFDLKKSNTGLHGIPFAVRFHLHPDVHVSADLADMTVSLWLDNGETWLFHHPEKCKLSLEPSSYMDPNRLMPRTSQQIVLSGQAVDYASRIRWTLSKVQEAKRGVFDPKHEVYFK